MSEGPMYLIGNREKTSRLMGIQELRLTVKTQLFDGTALASSLSPYQPHRAAPMTYAQLWAPSACSKQTCVGKMMPSWNMVLFFVPTEFCATSTCQFPTKERPVDRWPHFPAEPLGLEQVCLSLPDLLGNDSIYCLDGPLWMIASVGRLAQRVVEMVGK